MPESYYRTGQAAKQLGVSSYLLRRLCEEGEITAEITDGQQWRIPGFEIARLRREGIPDVPVESDEADPSHTDSDPGELSEGLLAAPSEELIEAAEAVKIVESRLKKRRIEKDAEEVEDWFRDRDRRQAALDAAERQKAEAAQAEQRRQNWLDSWIQYALNWRPWDAPRETELEIHQAVRTVLASVQPDQSRHTTQRLVEAAVEKALQPWKRKKEIRSAIESSLNRLPWDLNHRSEWAALKQRALEAAAAAIGKLPADVTSSEMEQVAWLAVQPMAREYAHWQDCQNLARGIMLPGGTFEDNQQAGQAVSEALARLPVGTSQKELEKAKEAALEPFRAAIQERKADEDQARREREKAQQRAGVERRVDGRLSSHLGDYLRELGEDEIVFDDAADRWEMETGLKKRIRSLLLSEVLEDPKISDQDIDELIEELVDEHKREFLDD